VAAVLSHQSESCGRLLRSPEVKGEKQADMRENKSDKVCVKASLHEGVQAVLPLFCLLSELLLGEQAQVRSHGPCLAQVRPSSPRSYLDLRQEEVLTSLNCEMQSQ